MIVPDVNLLLCATIEAFPQHRAARRWLEGLLNGDEPVGLALPALFGYVRLATSPRVFAPPMSLPGALETVDAWLTRPHVLPLLPGPSHLQVALRLLRATGSARDLTTDAQLAALAIEHGAVVHSNDTDFGRFPDLRWVDPLGTRAG